MDHDQILGSRFYAWLLIRLKLRFYNKRKLPLILYPTNKHQMCFKVAFDGKKKNKYKINFVYEKKIK
jgi:hypothetical protein